MRIQLSKQDWSLEMSGLGLAECCDLDKFHHYRRVKYRIYPVTRLYMTLTIDTNNKSFPNYGQVKYGTDPLTRP